MIDTMLKKIPYNSILRLIEWAKKHFYTNDWPEDIPTLVISMTAEELEDRLRSKHFEGIHLSYYYEGQVLNLRRPEFVKDGKQYELHIKAREITDELEVIGHTELSRYEHQEDHINTVDLEWKDAKYLAKIIAK